MVGCPKCRNSIHTIYTGRTLKGNGYRCNRCGHRWVVKQGRK